MAVLAMSNLFCHFEDCFESIDIITASSPKILAVIKPPKKRKKAHIAI